MILLLRVVPNLADISDCYIEDLARNESNSSSKMSIDQLTPILSELAAEFHLSMEVDRLNCTYWLGHDDSGWLEGSFLSNGIVDFKVDIGLSDQVDALRTSTRLLVRFAQILNAAILVVKEDDDIPVLNPYCLKEVYTTLGVQS